MLLTAERMSSESSVNSNDAGGNNNNNDNRARVRNNNGEGGEAVTRAEFNQLQENIRLIMERLEVRDRRSQGGSSHRRRSSDESDATSGRDRRGNRDNRHKGIENIKLKIPPFTSSSKPEEFLDWVPRVEKVFDCYE